MSQQKPDDHIEVDLELNELDITSAETKATYWEIQQYVMKQTGMMVSNLNIAQVRRKCGLDMRENYNLPKSDNVKQPKFRRRRRRRLGRLWSILGWCKYLNCCYMNLLII